MTASACTLRQLAATLSMLLGMMRGPRPAKAAAPAYLPPFPTSGVVAVEQRGTMVSGSPQPAARMARQSVCRRCGRPRGALMAARGCHPRPGAGGGPPGTLAPGHRPTGCCPLLLPRCR